MGPFNQSSTRGPRGRVSEPPTVSSTEIASWLLGRLPDEWFVDTPKVTLDRGEITVVDEIPAAAGGERIDHGSVDLGRIGRFRAETRTPQWPSLVCG
ncbi:MAG: hypothetical protein WAV88_03290 [Candidatus Nanopelagicales bacterium]